MKRRLHPFVAAVLLLLSSLSTACADVAPWQRAKLAEPTMDPGSHGSVGREHMQSVQEGAIGGSKGAASGCGCN